MSEIANNNNSRATTLICRYTKRFESIFVCAINCSNKCEQYLDNVNIAILEEFIQLYPDYEIKGEMMAVKKNDTEKKKTIKEYWIINEDNRVEEVSEKEILNNPQNYLDKQIWDKPPNQYEIVVALKRKKALR